MNATRTHNSPPADCVKFNSSITASITLPKSDISDFYRQAQAMAAEPYGTNWKSAKEWNALYCGSWDIEWIIKRPFNRPHNFRVPSKKTILAGIRKRMKSEPCAQITFQIKGDLWEKIQTIANHYGITPEEHCRCCFGYYATLWRSETKNTSALPEDPHHDTNQQAGAKIIPFMPNRIQYWNRNAAILAR